ncbi:DNA end-binding protein Ku [Sphingobacterium allocomposti]|uniref:Non-homologous end joining protein Ku n=1 Tax=Sphingobacterium allocomposti TaxID=415956 RepID=A0A5S5DK64_9SPHI|nr:Ku protein [Sphingobacterium composti Yoo et al. 2007 non Ten et al. 2007]TYP96311.1 DNA end-binding protein Ku [Sphingobacterium composti Yoo et al. 2007 non Ten et al. 2007]HLS94023.1 Ku protein [Sphingobacterium sp.]
MRAIWTGAIGFGLVNIPIKIFSAIQSSQLDFDMLDRKDLANIRYKRVNEKSGKEVEWDNIVKGYLLKDKYVVLEDADFEDAMPEKNKMISLQTFVKEKDIDSIYFDTPYYLEPQKGGEKAYTLLCKALEKTGSVGLSTFVMRTMENLAIVRPHKGMLVLNKLRFEEEIRETGDLKVPSSRLSKAEMDMATQLIKQNSSDFDISGYKNEYSKELLKIIKQKAQGKRATIRKINVDKENTKASELLAKLKASLA